MRPRLRDRSTFPSPLSVSPSGNAISRTGRSKSASKETPGRQGVKAIASQWAALHPRHGCGLTSPLLVRMMRYPSGGGFRMASRNRPAGWLLLRTTCGPPRGSMSATGHKRWRSQPGSKNQESRVRWRQTRQAHATTLQVFTQKVLLAETLSRPKGPGFSRGLLSI